MYWLFIIRLIIPTTVGNYHTREDNSWRLLYKKGPGIFVRDGSQIPIPKVEIVHIQIGWLWVRFCQWVWIDDIED